MSPLDYTLLTGSWLLWMAPFLLRKHSRQKAAKIDRRARWGILVQAFAYWLLWVSDFWSHAPAPWRLALSAAFFALGITLSWTAVSTLGRQWRIDAGLNPDHELVRSGPYHVIRHPIYASMLCMFCGSGMMVTPLPIFGISLALFLTGTEVRVRLEDSLLASRFGDNFREYQSNIAAYIPYLR